MNTCNCYYNLMLGNHYRRSQTKEKIVKYYWYHTLILNGCKQIIDESVKLLDNCHKFNLSGCNRITNDLIEKLENSLYL